jgi:tight adherence protein B
MTSASSWFWPTVAFTGAAAFCTALLCSDAIVAVVVGWRNRYVRWAERELFALQSQVTVRAFFVRHMLAVLGGAMLGLFVMNSPGKAVVFATLGLFAPIPWLKRERSRLQNRYNEVLDPSLQLMGNAVLATQNLADGWDALAKHGGAPLSGQAALLVKELRVGASIDEAMANLATRCQNRNVDSVITALSIGRRTGGNLPKVLDLIARVLRETMRVEGMIAAKTSEGRASGWIMSALPIGFMLAMSVIDPDWTAPLYNDVIGNVILGVIIAMTLGGAVLMRKVSTIDA